MSERMSIGRLYTGSVAPAAPKLRQRTTGEGASFQDVLKTKLVTFSHHAETRLKQRGIQLKPEQLQKLETAIDKAAAKGAKDSLVLFQDVAMIVNISNRTVVTAMDSGSMKDNVFTQIDSAVILS